MNKKFALGISVLLHPLLMPTIGLSIILFSGSFVSNLPLAARKLLILLFISGTLLFPLLMMPLLYMRGMITDLQMADKKQRMLPLAFTLIFYLLTFFLFLRIPVYRFIHSFMLGSVLLVFITLMINYRWKISIHMVGLGGICAFILMISILQNINLFPFLLAAILASGITGTARMYLQVHTASEIYIGYLVGLSVMTACVMVY